MDRRLAFKVIVDGREYRIYENGSVDGFEGCSIIVENYMPSLHAQAIAEYKRSLDSRFHTLETTVSNG